MRHRVASGDLLGDGAVAGVFGLLVKIAVFPPERGRHGQAIDEELDRLPVGHTAAGLLLVEGHEPVGRQRRGAGEIPAAGDVERADVALAPHAAGLERERERDGQ